MTSRHLEGCCALHTIRNTANSLYRNCLSWLQSLPGRYQEGQEPDEVGVAIMCIAGFLGQATALVLTIIGVI